MKRIAVLALMACVAAVLAPQAQADPIICGLYNTGVDWNGVPLAGGTPDPHYSLVSFTSDGYGPSTTSTQVIAQTSVTPGWPVAPAGPWVGDDPLSDWIRPNNPPANSPNDPSGTYVFQTTFQSSAAGSLNISGQWSVDNSLIGVSLNGNPVPGPFPGFPVDPTTPATPFTQWAPFSFQATLVAGTNTLDFDAYNWGPQTSGNPVGLRVEFTPGVSTNAAAPVPSPSSLVGLLGVGAMGLVSVSWRRRRAS